MKIKRKTDEKEKDCYQLSELGPGIIFSCVDSDILHMVMAGINTDQTSVVVLFSGNHATMLNSTNVKIVPGAFYRED